jgi:hypothetical protein
LIESLNTALNEGYLYAGTIMKLFGIKSTPNREYLSNLFLSHRDKYMDYYQREMPVKLGSDEKNIPILKAVLYVKNNYSENSNLGKKILARLMASLNEMILTEEDIPMPKHDPED